MGSKREADEQRMVIRILSDCVRILRPDRTQQEAEQDAASIVARLALNEPALLIYAVDGIQLEIKTHESGFHGFYVDGKPTFGRKSGDSLFETLRLLSDEIGSFKMVNGGVLTDDELEKCFS